MVARLPLFLLLGALGAFALACGTGEGTHGGAANLPSAGIIPHVAMDEPVLSEPGHDLRRPWVLEITGGLRMWVADRDVGSGETDHIQWHDSPTGWEWTPEGALAIEASSEGWEEGLIDAPCVVQSGDSWRMYYTGGDVGGLHL